MGNQCIGFTLVKPYCVHTEFPYGQNDDDVVATNIPIVLFIKREEMNAA